MNTSCLVFYLKSSRPETKRNFFQVQNPLDHIHWIVPCFIFFQLDSTLSFLGEQIVAFTASALEIRIPQAMSNNSTTNDDLSDELPKR